MMGQQVGVEMVEPEMTEANRGSSFVRSMEVVLTSLDGLPFNSSREPRSESKSR